MNLNTFHFEDKCPIHIKMLKFLKKLTISIIGKYVTDCISFILMFGIQIVQTLREIF